MAQLSLVLIRDDFRHLQFEDDEACDNKVGVENTDLGSPEENGKCYLLFGSKASLP